MGYLSKAVSTEKLASNSISSVMTQVTYPLYVKVKDDKGRVCEVPFAVTTYEQLVIDDVTIEDMLGDKSYFPPYLIFNKKIVKALKTLLYPFFYNNITGQPLDEDEEEYDNIEVSTNEFEILFSQFSGTF